VDSPGGPSVTDTLDNNRTRRGPAASILETELVYGAFGATFAGVTTESGGRLLITEDADANRDTVSGTFRFRDSQSGVTNELRDFTVVTRYDNYGVPRRIEESYEGRVYISDIGFLTVRTDSPLVRSDPALAYPDVGGVLLLSGSGASMARLDAASARTALVQLDATGDGTFEITATVAWDQIGRPTSLALTDGDGDGMHDSWESANGLNPARAADAGEDADGDGFTNRVEYLAASAPGSLASVPKGVAALGATLRVASAATATTDDDAEYELRVTNAGPDTATTLRARLAIDGADRLGQSAGDPWDCIADSTHVTCTLPDLASGATATLRYRAHTRTSAGTVQVSGAISAETVDVDRGNNSARLAQQVVAFSPDVLATLTRPVSATSLDASGRRLFGVAENDANDPSRPNVFVVDLAAPAVARDLVRVASPTAVAAALDGESVFVATGNGFVQLAADDGRVLRLFGRLPGRTRDDRLTTDMPVTIPGRPDLLLLRVEGDAIDPNERLVLYRNGTPLPDTIGLSALNDRGVAWDAERGQGLLLRNVNRPDVADLLGFNITDTGVQLAGTRLRDVVAGRLVANGRHAATTGGALIDLATDTLLLNDPERVAEVLVDSARQRLYTLARRRFDVYDARDGRWLFSAPLDSNALLAGVADGNLFVLRQAGRIDFVRLPVPGF
jgi:hypothetical protein